MGTASSKKFVKLVAGTLTEEAALVTSAGAADSNKMPALDSSGRLDVTFMPSGLGADTLVLICSENLAAGNLVNIYNYLNAGTAAVRKADASTSGKEAHGFVLAASFSGAACTVYFSGTNALQSGMTPGPQFLSTTPGTCTLTSPVGAGQVSQRVGVATSATTLNFATSAPVTLS